MPDATCAVDGCDRSGKLTRGWCSKHYQRWRAYGSVGNDGPKPCCDCNDTFVPATARQKRCTNCRAKRKRTGKHRLLRLDHCAWCGRAFEVRADNPDAKGCSIACGMMIAGRSATQCEVKWVHCKLCDSWRTTRTSHECPGETYPPPPRQPMNCTVCDKEMEPTHSTRLYCSQACKSIVHGGSTRSIWIIDCAWCRTTYVSRIEHGTYCSRRCSRQAERKRRGPDRFLVPDPVRRAIYERDGWRCQLCGKKVNRNAGPNTKWGPSLDHIVPRSRGGADTTDNLQLSHRMCNSIKCDGVWRDGEQLSLLALASA